MLENLTPGMLCCQSVILFGAFMFYRSKLVDDCCREKMFSRIPSTTINHKRCSDVWRSLFWCLAIFLSCLFSFVWTISYYYFDSGDIKELIGEPGVLTNAHVLWESKVYCFVNTFFFRSSSVCVICKKCALLISWKWQNILVMSSVSDEESHTPEQDLFLINNNPKFFSIHYHW